MTSKLFQFFIKYKPYIVIIVLWLIGFVIVNPIGEFPVNDDWAYSKNVYNLVVNNQFVVDTFPAMNLISQTIYGSIFVLVFGFSFTILRISIFLLAITSSLVLYKIILRLSNGNRWFSCFTTVIIYFNTLLLPLSFTFMTDVFFVSFLTFAFYQFLLYLDSNKLIHYLLYTFFCIIAVLNRQQGLLISLLSIGFLFRKPFFLKKQFLLAIVPPVLTWLAHDKYRHYLTEYHIGHGIQDVDNLKEHLSNANFSDHILHAGDSLLVIGYVLFPICLFLIFQKQKFSLKEILYLSVITISVLLVIWNFCNYYPLGNVSNVLEIGPKVVKTQVIFTPSYVSQFKFIRVLLSFISIVLCVFFILKNDNKYNLFRNKISFYIIFLLIILTYFVFVSISKAYFDRYSIPLVLFCCLLLIPNTLHISKSHKFILNGLVVFLYLFSVIETKDFFNWQKTRWAALNYLHAQNITAKNIDGGFEYNGWYKPTDSWPPADKSWWWVLDDEYVVSHSKLDNYKIERAFTYQRYIPYKIDSVFILKKESIYHNND